MLPTQSSTGMLRFAIGFCVRRRVAELLETNGLWLERLRRRPRIKRALLTAGDAMIAQRSSPMDSHGWHRSAVIVLTPVAKLCNPREDVVSFGAQGTHEELCLSYARVH